MPESPRSGTRARYAAAVLRIVLAAAGLLLAQVLPLPWLQRLEREDRLAMWIVLVVLALIGYMHNVNHWSPDGKGLLRPEQVGLWKTEVVLGVALAAPGLSTVARLLHRVTVQVVGREFTKEFALYVNFSGIALALWDREALLTREVGAMLLAWIALAELTLYASD